MTIGTDMTAEQEQTAEHAEPRDEAYWITQVNKATLVTGERTGLLKPTQASRFARAQREVEQQLSRPGVQRPGIYIRYEPLMIERAGVEVTLMHAGRSSQDIHATFLRAITRDEILKIAEQLNAVRRALYTLSEQYRDVLVPCYTNGVAAQPNRLSHQWLGHLAGFERDFARLREFYARLNLCPMGTTVLNGSCWPLDREAMARYLGFAAPIDNAYDAAQISSEDVILEASQVLVTPMLHIGHFIADVMTQYAQSRPWILVGATYASSAMPQKRNPGSLIDVRRDASAVLAELQSAAWRSHNLMPGMYDAKDQKINSSFMSDACIVLEGFARVLPKLSVNVERALEEINSDWTASQNIADVLMRDYGIAFRLGHRFASELVSACRTESYTPLTFPYALARQVWERMASTIACGGVPADLPMDEAALRAALDPRIIIRERRTSGGPQDAELERMLELCRHLIEADECWIGQRKANLKASQSNLEKDFEDLISRGAAK